MTVVVVAVIVVAVDAVVVVAGWLVGHSDLHSLGLFSTVASSNWQKVVNKRQQWPNEPIDV